MHDHYMIYMYQKPPPPKKKKKKKKLLKVFHFFFFFYKIVNFLHSNFFLPCRTFIYVNFIKIKEKKKIPKVLRSRVILIFNANFNSCQM